MKFKRLPQNELEKLEKEFVQFLVSNGITADDWLKLQKESSHKVENLIGLFSDLVYEKVLEKVHYLEFRTANDIKCFFCEKEQITLVGIRNDNAATQFNFDQIDDLDKLKQIITLEASLLKVYSAKKPYKLKREEEIFAMMENGAVKTDGWLYSLMEKLYIESKETKQ